MIQYDIRGEPNLKIVCERALLNHSVRQFDSSRIARTARTCETNIGQ